MEEYDRNWKSADDINNVKMKPYMELILPEKYAEARKELYLQLQQEPMRQAFGNRLKKNDKKSKPKVPKKHKNTPTKKGKSKPEPDLTADQSLASLVAELVESGIIIDVPKKSFDDFIGDYNYLAYENRHRGKT